MASQKKITDNIIYPFTSKYPTEYIKVHYNLNNELEIMIEKSGYKKQFLKKYQKSLRFLENLKINCIKNPNLFEKLLQVEDLYSMIFKGEKNIRILFSFMSIDGESKAVLLSVFEEKSTSDYESGIRIANERKKEIILFYSN